MRKLDFVRQAGRTLHRPCRWLLSIVVLLSTVQAGSPTGHPLDPLDEEEVRAVVRILRAEKRVDDASRFYSLVLHEPPKSEVLAFQPGTPFRREAIVVVFERQTNQTFEAIVDLRAGVVASWQERRGVQPHLMREDFQIASTIVNADPAWRAALLKRGITDSENVEVDGWAAGWYGIAKEAGIRVLRGIPFYRGQGINQYSRPIEGLIVHIDLTNRRILRISDRQVVPVARRNAELDPESNQPLRPPASRLEISQPDGAGFERKGHEVRWQNWRFRYTLHPREGLVLHTVTYEEKGRSRSVLYRGSLSEMVVPYGDPSEGWFIRNAFDEGEYGIGLQANELDRNDVPPNATLLPATLVDEYGKTMIRQRAVALFERDGGLLWKHVSNARGTQYSESRRGRQLVLAMITTIGNYEYGFHWVFHQDGALEMEALLTGIMSVKGVDPSQHQHHRDYGHLVAKEIEAVHHQHFFNFRLDLDVDGAQGNSVVEQNTRILPPSRSNPQRNAFTMTERILRREWEARRTLNLSSNRHWKVINTREVNALGQPTGYMLITGENSISYSGINSFVRQRAGFMNYHLWVTPYTRGEDYAAGFYVNQSRGGDGLPAWTRQNRTIEDRDLVLWYSLGVTHLPRPEDWPVMPVHKTGFKLIPNGFFASNPAMDLPR
jgi:primary-amine oxidase